MLLNLPFRYEPYLVDSAPQSAYMIVLTGKLGREPPLRVICIRDQEPRGILSGLYI